MAAWLERHRRSLLLLLALLALGGAWAAWGLPVALLPNIAFPRIVVNVEAGERPVDRMVIEVTRPLEQALRAVPDVRSIRSTSSRGAADLSVNFSWGTDMVTALLQVESAVNQTLPDLPPGVHFLARRMDPTVFPVLGLAVTSANPDLVALRDFAYYQLRPLLSTVGGVARIEVLGGRQAEYHVLVNPARLQAVGLSPDDVAAALAANNVVTAVGRIEDHFRLYLVVADTRLRGSEDIGRTVLRTGETGMVRVEDVAEVRRGERPEWTRVTANGRDAVLLNVIQQRGANTVAIAQGVRARLAAFRTHVPRDVEIKPYYDQADLVTASAGSVRDAILVGAGFAALVQLVFLRNLRITLIIALLLPAVLAITVLILKTLAMSFNIMTLGGLAAAVGLVVDDGVVILEYIMRRREAQPEAAPEGVLAAATEMARPLAGSSLATILVFVPPAFLSGVTGGFFKALALTMAAALAISFLVALLVVPVLADLLLRPTGRAAGRPPSRVQGLYERVMRRLLRWPLWSVPAGALLAAVGYLAWSHVGTGFIPHMDEGGFVLDYRAPPGTSLTETDRLLRQVESILLHTPEVDSYSRRTGLQLGGALTEANQGDFFIHLRPSPRRPIDDVMADVRRAVEGGVPGLRIETAQLMEDLIGDLTAVPQPIEVKLFGDDAATLGRLAPQIAERLGKVPGVVEVFPGTVVAGDAIKTTVDRTRAAADGLDAETLTRQIRDQVGGLVATQTQAGEKMIGVRVWSPIELRRYVESVTELRIRAADGHYARVRRDATVGIEEGQAQVVREDLKQMVAPTGRIEGRDLGSTLRDVQGALADVALPAGVYVEYGGLYREQQESFRGMLVVIISAVALVTVLLVFLYERAAAVVSVLATTLLSGTGVFLGLWVTGTELNISSLMGLTMIVGIVTEKAIFYFAEMGSDLPADPAALIRAGQKRMRPVLMTALIAILALMPLALQLGTGASMQAPLAIAIISGLILAVPLVLFVMPALYLVLGRRPAAPGPEPA
jgi:CzcA family heavy metal efflux pump